MKTTGLVAAGRAVVVSRDYLASGRCFRPSCRANHLVDVAPGDVAILACPACAADLIIAFSPALGCLELACGPCGIVVGFVPLLSVAETIDLAPTLQAKEDATRAGGPS